MDEWVSGRKDDLVETKLRLQQQEESLKKTQYVS